MKPGRYVLKKRSEVAARDFDLCVIEIFYAGDKVYYRYLGESTARLLPADCDWDLSPVI